MLGLGPTELLIIILIALLVGYPLRLAFQDYLLSRPKAPATKPIKQTDHIICPKCGSQNTDISLECIICGQELSLEAQNITHTDIGQETMPEQGEIPKLQKTSVFLVIILNLATFDLYRLYWFVTRRDSLNGLSSSKKINKQTVHLLIWLIALFLFIPMLIQPLLDKAPLLEDVLASFIAIGGIVIYINLIVSMRKIMIEHSDEEFKISFPVFLIPAIIFNNIYLQYKINRLVEMHEASSSSE